MWAVCPFAASVSSHPGVTVARIPLAPQEKTKESECCASLRFRVCTLGDSLGYGSVLVPPPCPNPSLQLFGSRWLNLKEALSISADLSAKVLKPMSI